MDRRKRQRIATRVARSVGDGPLMADDTNTSFQFSGHDLPPEVMAQLEQSYSSARDQWAQQTGQQVEDLQKEHPAFIHHTPLEEGAKIPSGHQVRFTGQPVEHQGQTYYPGLASV